MKGKNYNFGSNLVKFWFHFSPNFWFKFSLILTAVSNDAIMKNPFDVHDECIETAIEMLINFAADFIQIHWINDDTTVSFITFPFGRPVFEHFELIVEETVWIRRFLYFNGEYGSYFLIR